MHYGRRPGRAGFGFYWGSICFYVDSTDGITLPRRARIINALAGLAVDVVTVAILVIVASVAAPVLIVTVFWRIAFPQLLSVIDNGLPILEVDGHVALADYLDEQDLAPRSREALGRRLRGIKRVEAPRWLAGYGALSLVGGIVLMVLRLWVWWIAAGDLVRSLWHGNWVEILLAGGCSVRSRGWRCRGRFSALTGVGRSPRMPGPPMMVGSRGVRCDAAVE